MIAYFDAVDAAAGRGGGKVHPGGDADRRRGSPGLEPAAPWLARMEAHTIVLVREVVEHLLDTLHGEAFERAPLITRLLRPVSRTAQCRAQAALPAFHEGV